MEAAPRSPSSDPAPGERPGRLRVPRGPSWRAFLAFALYFAVSLVLLAPPLFAHRFVYLGDTGQDPKFFMWALAWWPHAIAHAQNPFIAHSIWRPAGYDLAWTTAVPGPAMALAAVTLLAGPLTSYNLLVLLSPALAGLAAYALCRLATGAFWPSLAGGYLFGFSTYEFGQLRGHANLFLVFLVPLGAVLVALRLSGRLRPWVFVALLGALLTVQFLISNEVFTTMTVIGGGAALIGLAMAGNRRRTVVRTIGWAAIAYAAAAVVLSPYLYYIFAYGFHGRPGLGGGADLGSLVVPSSDTLVLGKASESVFARFGTSNAEDGAYLGIPLLIVVAAFAATTRRSRLRGFVLACFGLAVVLTLGRTLRVDNHQLIPLPWAVIRHLPLLTPVLAVRFSLYVALITSVIVALWLRDAGPRWRGARWAIVALAAIFLLPDVGTGFWHSRAPIPAFFADGTYHRFLRQDDTVLVVGDPAASMLWQAETAMSFRLAGGYTGLGPRGYLDGDVFRLVAAGRASIPDLPEVRTFIAEHGVSVVLWSSADPPRTGRTAELLAALGATPTTVDGVVLYRVGPGAG